MKKILWIVLLTAAPAFADYMIVSDNAVKSVAVDDSSIIEVQPISTIDNEKRFIILTPKSQGITKINVTQNDGIKIIKVKVGENSTEIEPIQGFEYFETDYPPKGIEILPPPTQGGM